MIRGRLKISFEKEGDRLKSHAELDLRIPIKGEMKFSLAATDVLGPDGDYIFESMLLKDHKQQPLGEWWRADDEPIMYRSPKKKIQLPAVTEKVMSSLALLAKVLGGSREKTATVSGEYIYHVRCEDSPTGATVFLRKIAAAAEEKKICELLLSQDGDLTGARLTAPLIGKITLHKV